MSAVSDVMWMDGTAGTGFWGIHQLADRNPFRWNKPQSFADAIQTITEKKEKGELTAVWAKVPARMTSQTLKYPSVDEAVAAIREMDPVVAGPKKAWEQAEEQVQQLEKKQAGMEDELAQAAERVASALTTCEGARSALDKAKASEEEAQKKLDEAQKGKEEADQQKEGVQKQTETIEADLEETQERASKPPSSEASTSEVMWMDGTAATGLFGFNEWADNNPFRWNNPQSFSDATKTITEEKEKGKLTAVWLKVPAKMSAKTLKYPSVDEAVAAIGAMDPMKALEDAVKDLKEKQGALPAMMALLDGHVTSMEAKCKEARAALDKAKAAVEPAQEALNEAEKAKEEASQQQEGTQRQAEAIQSDLKETQEQASKLKEEYEKVA